MIGNTLSVLSIGVAKFVNVLSAHSYMAFIVSLILSDRYTASAPAKNARAFEKEKVEPTDFLSFLSAMGLEASRAVSSFNRSCVFFIVSNVVNLSIIVSNDLNTVVLNTLNCVLSRPTNCESFSSSVGFGFMRGVSLGLGRAITQPFATWPKLCLESSLG